MQTGYNQNLIQNTAIDKSENRIEKWLVLGHLGMKSAGKKNVAKYFSQTFTHITE